MKRRNNFWVLKNLVFAIIIFASFTNITAKNKADDAVVTKGFSEQTIAIITSHLSNKLRSDLADRSIVVKISDIEKYQAAGRGVAIKGSGICLMTGDDKQLPIRFEAKLNAQSLSDIKYDFLQYETSAFVSSTEEVLMKELMKKISADYKTDEIVISIDGFETVETAKGKGYVGNGEIRIGEVEWRKIKFDVVLAADNKAAKIKYDVQK